MNAGTSDQSSQNNISVFLFGAILNIMAAIDYPSLIDYSVKALVGGIIWLGFKILGDYITNRMKEKEDKQC